MKYAKGESGNPNGRPRGTSQAAMLRKAIEADIPAIISTMVGQAKQGDTAAAKLLLDRSIPAIKPVAPVATVRGLKGKTMTEQAELIVVAMGNGTISVEQSQTMLTALSSLARIKSVDEIEQRLQALEANRK